MFFPTTVQLLCLQCRTVREIISKLNIQAYCHLSALLFPDKATAGSLVRALSFLQLSNLFCPGFVNISMDYLLPESLSCNLTESHREKSASYNAEDRFFCAWVRGNRNNLSLLSSPPHFCDHLAFTITAFTSICRPPGNTTSALF